MKEIKATAPAREELYQEYKRLSEENERLTSRLSLALGLMHAETMPAYLQSVEELENKQMLDWDDNAKAAVREFAAYIGQSDKCERYLKAFATKKTVADAVEYYKGVWPSNTDDCIWYSETDGFEYGFVECDSQEVCTRAEFEAYVKEQEGERWTHTLIHGGGIKCRVIAVDGEHSWVLTEHGSKVPEYTSSLKPIKPTISECDAKALELFANKSHRHGVAWAVKEYLDGHDII